MTAVIFEVNLLQSSRFGDALRVVQENLDAKNYYAFNPAIDIRPPERAWAPKLPALDAAKPAASEAKTTETKA